MPDPNDPRAETRRELLDALARERGGRLESRSSLHGDKAPDEPDSVTAEELQALIQEVDPQ